MVSGEWSVGSGILGMLTCRLAYSQLTIHNSLVKTHTPVMCILYYPVDDVRGASVNE
jgi:hypothetical protein